MAGSALACAAVAQPIPSSDPPVSAIAATRPSLAQAVAAAWQRSLQASEAQGQRQQAQARQAAANSWLSAAPSLALSQREGGRNTAAGSRETELSLALPLWSPDQRGSAAQAAQLEVELSDAAERAARLQLAGQVRETAARLHGLDVQASLAGDQARLLKQVADDVARRVAAGDLAPSDALAAQAEWLSARAEEEQIRQRLQAERSGWTLLTGLAQWPHQAAPGTNTSDEAPSAQQPELHPDLDQAERAAELGRLQLALTQAQLATAPELSLGLRQERPGQGAALQQSVVVGLRLPFGASAHTKPRLAAALAAQQQAISAASLTRERLTLAVEQARAARDSSQAQARLTRERATLLRQRAQLIDKSFKAGESPLPDLLRALGAAAQAEAASATQQTELALAQARLQQALGITP